MSESTVVYPHYIRIVERKPNGWRIRKGEIFYNRLPVSIDLQDFELMYGVSEQQMIIELFRINGGRQGYYLANLRHKKYYYCGLEWSGIKRQLLEIGIGREDPNE
jgi:hypothetical protein